MQWMLGHLLQKNNGYLSNAIIHLPVFGRRPPLCWQLRRVPLPCLFPAVCPGREPPTLVGAHGWAESFYPAEGKLYD
jgi:hypothetical protein